jgi:hypothetical protein
MEDIGIMCGHLVYCKAKWYILFILVYFVVFWYILWSFGIFCGLLVYFVVFWYTYVVVVWYIFPHFDMLYQEKSGNPVSEFSNFSNQIYQR